LIEANLNENIVYVSKSNESKYSTIKQDHAILFEKIHNSLKQIPSNTFNKKVFILCNFVYHKRPNESDHQFKGKTTQPEVLLLLVDEVIKALGENIEISIGNAPIQSASWEKIIHDLKLNQMIDDLKNKYRNSRIDLCDLRLDITKRNFVGWSESVKNDDSFENVVEIDLAEDSLLDIQYEEGVHYRIVDYSTERIEACHAKGKHVYLVNKKILDSSVLISVPKLKTHEKVGMTAAIKGCVGIVTHKDCLAHHRKGGSQLNGDEYPGNSLFRKFMSNFHDYVNSEELSKTSSFMKALKIVDRILRKLIKEAGGVIHGSWAGNDTTWRMALDIARISLYADSTGEMQNTPARYHFSLTDGIISGEGQGPLNSSPKDLGYLSWSENILSIDAVNALTMGFDIGELKIVNHAVLLNKYKLATYANFNDIKVNVNGEVMNMHQYNKSTNNYFLRPAAW
jgi:uncharacterized protein (DUF362 family)